MLGYITITVYICMLVPLFLVCACLPGGPELLLPDCVRFVLCGLAADLYACNMYWLSLLPVLPFFLRATVAYTLHTT